MDYMKGPFILPNNIKENDYIELGQLGAYGLTFRTKFNGFYSNEIYEVDDNPIMSMYDKETKKAFSCCLMSDQKSLGHNSKKDFLKKSCRAYRYYFLRF